MIHVILFYYITLSFRKLWKLKLCDQALRKNHHVDLTVVYHWCIVVVRMYGTWSSAVHVHLIPTILNRSYKKPTQLPQ